MSTITDDVHPLLRIELRINLGPALTRPMPHVGPLNTATTVEKLYLTEPSSST